MMDPAVWNKIKDAFDVATALPDDERVVFLQGQPEETRHEILRLIDADRKAGNFIAEPAVIDLGIANGSEEVSLCGTKIDEYELLREIGYGGMGTVYLASRRGDFDKNVALKLIKRGMDTNAVLKRFVMERQILARLQHTNIASLLDGGTTSDGLPYFVMEYVDGEPITKFCDGHGYSIDERLELFQKVCSAVSYAHQNLIVHRDIKPSNILVTDDGTPKLLDFGIAKLLHPDWSLDTNEATATMFRVMTPEYASPEQIQGLPMTTSSDVYSLGVVLYELLSGERPYKIESRSPDEIARIVLTDEPARPSSVVSSRFQVSGSKSEMPTFTYDGRQTAGGEQNLKLKTQNPKSLRGDIDNIILKALRKEPERRYQSVQEFSEDIRRHLIGLPVTASADTFFYRVGKFVKRHRTGVIAGLLVFLTLIAAIAVTGWQAVVARRERDKAELRFNQVRELANIVLFDYHDKIKELPGTVQLREQLVSDALKYLDNLAESSEGDISLQRDLVKAYDKIGEVQFGLSNGNLGNSSGALNSYRKAVDIAEKITGDTGATGEDYRKLADLYISLGGVLGETGDIQSDISMKQKAVVILEKLLADDPKNVELENSLAKTYWYLGTPLTIAGDDEGARENFQRAGDIYEKLSRIEPQNLRHLRNIALTDKYLSQLYTRQHKFDESLDLANRALELDTRRASELPNEAQAKYDISASYSMIGDCLYEMQQYPDAAKTFDKVISIREVLANNDPKNAYFRDTLTETYYRLSRTWLRLGNPLRAFEYAQKAISLLEISIKADELDVFNQIHLAQYKTSLGEASMTLALDKKLSAPEKKARLSSAHINFRESVEIWNKLQDRKAIPKYNEVDVKASQTKLEECERTVAELVS